MASNPQCCCVVCGNERNESIFQDVCFFRSSDIAKKTWLADLLAVLKRYGHEGLAISKEEDEKFLENQDFICSRHFEDPSFRNNPQFDSMPLKIPSIEELCKKYFPSAMALGSSCNEVVCWRKPPQLELEDSGTHAFNLDDSVMIEINDSPPPLIPIYDIIDEDSPTVECHQIEELHFPTTVYPATLSVEPEAGFQFTHLKEVDTSSTYVPNKEPDISAKRKLEQESVAQRPSKRSAIDIVSESRILENLDLNSTSFDSKPSLVFDASEVFVAIEDPYCEDYDLQNGYRVEKNWLTLMCRKRFCRLGCVCESLNSTKAPPDHCKRPDCMLQCGCVMPISKSDSVTETDTLVQNAQSCDKATKTFGSGVPLSDLEEVFSKIASNVFNSHLENLTENCLEKIASKMITATSSLQHFTQPDLGENLKNVVLDNPDNATPVNDQTTVAEITTVDLRLESGNVPKMAHPTIGEEISTEEDLTSRPEFQLNEKQKEIDDLKNRLNAKDVTAEMAECFPKLVETAKNYLDLITVLQIDPSKIEASKFIGVHVKQPTASTSVSGTSSVQKKDEPQPSMGNFDAKGVCLDFYPFKENVLDQMAQDNTATNFIRQVMRKMFTFEYLSTTTFTGLGREYVAAISDATLKRFSTYIRKGGDSVPLNFELVKYVMTSEFSAKRQERKRRGN